MTPTVLRKFTLFSILVAIALPTAGLCSDEHDYGFFTLDTISIEYAGRQLFRDQIGLAFETRWTSWLRPSAGISVSDEDRNLQGDVSLKFGPPISITQLYLLAGTTFGKQYLYMHLGLGLDVNLGRLHLSAMAVLSPTSNGEAKVSPLVPGFDVG